MLKFAKTVYQKLQLFTLCQVWRKQYWFEKTKVQLNTCIRVPLDGRRLILIPHADDEWIGCSSLISNPLMEVILCNMSMLGGDNQKLHNIRFQELEQIAQKYHRQLITIEDKKGFTLASIIQRIKPDIITIPFYIDWHEDHIKVIEILRKVLIDDDIENILIEMYQVSLPIISEEITNAQSMTVRQWRHKWRVFRKVYKSQRHIPFQRFGYNERISGVLVNSFAAEVFCVKSFNEWLADFHLLPNPEEKKLFFKNLNDISTTRDIIHKIFIKKRAQS